MASKQGNPGATGGNDPVVAPKSDEDVPMDAVESNTEEVKTNKKRKTKRKSGDPKKVAQESVLKK